jgi:hypothetical protein
MKCVCVPGTSSTGNLEMPQATHSKQINEFSEFVIIMMSTAVSHDALNGYSQVNI